MSIEYKGSFPLNSDLEQNLATLDNLQLAWLSGYCWAKAKGITSGQISSEICKTTQTTATTPLKVTIISVSQTGNARSVANQLEARLKAESIETNLVSAKDYKAKNIANEGTVLIISSTQGEGEPPEEGVVLYKFLHGKKAPGLENLQFAVFGLGDSSYPNFCQAGKDFDRQLENLGATRLLERVDADLIFQPAADEWVENITSILKEKAVSQVPAVLEPQVDNKTIPESRYNKDNPFPAALLTNQRITDLTAEKDVRHIELDLSDSGLTYQAGDALGVWFNNDPTLVQEFLDILALTGEEQVSIANEVIDLRSALLTKLELTQATRPFVKNYAAFANNKKLNEIISDNDKLSDFIATTLIIDVIEEYPATLTAEQFIGLLRPLAPRLYSISSSPDEVGEEVHLTVGVVRFKHNGKTRMGAASSYLAERVEEDETVRIFIEHNDNFRLPKDSRKPIIMIGSGTGIAPFRAFVQQRAAQAAEGKNWLIFGNQHFALDFLYQAEWQQFKKDGYLHKYSFAWSRDQEQKIYVQDKIRKNAEDIWQWIEEGAYIYICGDAKHMAKGVEQALLDVIEQQGKYSRDAAEEYLNELREAQRYQRDIY